MKAMELYRQRIIFAENKFAELVLWRLPQPLPGSRHSFKYRLAYVVNGECVLRCDNETGKGDRRHLGTVERSYRFISPEKLLKDFHGDSERWEHENSNA